MPNGWIGVDLDGTLAYYDGWRGELHIGEPIKPMLQRVQEWLDRGIEVRIFTARIASSQDGEDGILRIREAIQHWCYTHVGKVLPITNVKDFSMIELWDDRAVQVIHNTGHRADGVLS